MREPRVSATPEAMSEAPYSARSFDEEEQYTALRSVLSDVERLFRMDGIAVTAADQAAADAAVCRIVVAVADFHGWIDRPGVAAERRRRAAETDEACEPFAADSPIGNEGWA